MDVVHASNFESSCFILYFSLAGNEYYWNLTGCRVGFQPGTYFKPVHAGHHYVQQNQVGHRFAAGQLQSLSSVCRNSNAVEILEDGIA